MLGAIAIEEHFLPPGGAELLTSPGWFKERSGRGHRSAPDTDPRLEEVDACGIEHAVLSLASDGIHAIGDADLAVRTASGANMHSSTGSRGGQ